MLAPWKVTLTGEKTANQTDNENTQRWRKETTSNCDYCDCIVSHCPITHDVQIHLACDLSVSEFCKDQKAMSFWLRKCLEPFRIACCLRKALPQRCCPVLRALRVAHGASFDCSFMRSNKIPTREACARPLAGLRMIWGPIGGRRQDLRTGRARTSNLAANGPPRTAATGFQWNWPRLCQGPTLNRRVAGRTTVLWIALWMPLGQSTTEIVRFCVIDCHRYCRVSWCLISFMRFIMRDLSGSSWDSSLFHEFILSEKSYWTFFGTSSWIWWSASGLEPLGSLWRHLRRRPHQAEQDRQGALHSKFVGIKMRCHFFFEVSLDLIDESPRIHRRCLPATGVRSSGLGSVRLPGFPAKEASWGSSSLHWHKELSSLVVFPPFSTGLECGSLAENKTCDNGDCPVDCALSEWGLFLSFHTNYIKIRKSASSSFQSSSIILILDHPLLFSLWWMLERRMESLWPLL